MPSTRSRGVPLTPYDPKLKRTLIRMDNQGVPVKPNKGIKVREVGNHPPLLVKVHN